MLGVCSGKFHVTALHRLFYWVTPLQEKWDVGSREAVGWVGRGACMRSEISFRTESCFQWFQWSVLINQCLSVCRCLWVLLLYLVNWCITFYVYRKNKYKNNIFHICASIQVVFIRLVFLHINLQKIEKCLHQCRYINIIHPSAITERFWILMNEKHMNLSVYMIQWVIVTMTTYDCYGVVSYWNSGFDHICICIYMVSQGGGCGDVDRLAVTTFKWTSTERGFSFWRFPAGDGKLRSLLWGDPSGATVVPVVGTQAFWGMASRD